MNGRASRDELKLRAMRVREELQAKLPELLARLGFKDRVQGPRLHTTNPRRPNSKKGHFVVWLDGPGAGSWKDFGTGGVDKGDVYDLIGYTQHLDRWIDAYRWALAFLGRPEDETPRSAERARIERENAEADRRARELQAQADQRAQGGRLFHWWTTLPPITGTVAETYLREARGIPLERIGAPKYRLGALRYATRVEHIDDQTGEVTYWPCMVAVMVNGPTATGVHRTWLRPDGRGKADVHRPKKMLGRTKGSAIRLTPGPSGLNPTLAVKRGVFGPLAIGEGIETSLTVAAAAPHWRVWAAGSLSHMGALAWPECASNVVLLKDNDWGAEAQAAFDRVVGHWRSQARGRPLDVISSAAGNDFNDWLQGAA